ncbi:MAG: acetyl esterase [Actinomycetota bacterium]
MTTIDLDTAVAEARRFVANAEAAIASMPSPHTLPLDVQRQMMAAGAEPLDPRTTTDVIGGVPVRCFEPEGQLAGTYLHIHGGGWTMGSNAFQDARLWRFAESCRARVVSIEYRLAPEHPFPANIDDCLTVARELDGPIVVGGESAGAHLSALLLTRHRDGFVGANLAYGCFDMGMSDAARAWGDRVLVLSTPIIGWHLDQLLPGLDVAQRRDPAISPLFADLEGMPPALLTVGTDDPLLDDSRRLAARWPGAIIDVYDAGFHAFDLMPLQLGELATRRQLDFVRERLASS